MLNIERIKVKVVFENRSIPNRDILKNACIFELSIGDELLGIQALYNPDHADKKELFYLRLIYLSDTLEISEHGRIVRNGNQPSAFSLLSLMNCHCGLIEIVEDSYGLSFREPDEFIFSFTTTKDKIILSFKDSIQLTPFLIN